MIDDTELLHRARALETDALARIHDAYYPVLFRYVSFRIADRDTAEDLVSDIFLRFLSALRERQAPQHTLRGWLYGVAAHVVSDYHRRNYRAPNDELSEGIASHTAGPEELAEQQITRAELRQALTHLTEEQQQVIALRFGYELPIQEVARTLGKSEGAIKQLQARAIASLARTMLPGMVE